MYDSNDIIASRVLEAYKSNLQCIAKHGGVLPERYHIGRIYSELLGLSKQEFESDIIECMR